MEDRKLNLNQLVWLVNYSVYIWRRGKENECHSSVLQMGGVWGQSPCRWAVSVFFFLKNSYLNPISHGFEQFKENKNAKIYKQFKQLNCYCHPPEEPNGKTACWSIIL